ncbi:MAG: sigma-70 family RNA polymerase sigma factor [Vampirovibrionales bacterium]|nr:sigma-70 family RNA polymerase sigma factor [Vampirovibrionales bacterium]
MSARNIPMPKSLDVLDNIPCENTLFRQPQEFSTPSVEDYSVKTINQLSVITANDEISEATIAIDTLVLQYLGQKKTNADRQKLRNKIVAACLPYVQRLAKNLARRSDDPVEDLIQVGTIGLMKALDRFNPLAGTQFKTYATCYINGEIRHYLRDQVAMIKPSRKAYELYYRMNQIVERLSHHLGRTPTDFEIAQELECPVTELHQARVINQRSQTLSLDHYQIGHQSDEPSYIERLVDDKHSDSRLNHENRLMIDKALQKLKPELRIVIQLTYFEDRTQTEIAHRLKISQMQVSRRLKKAMDLLAQCLTDS